MASTVAPRRPSQEVPLLDAVGHRMAKAELRVPESPALRDVVADVLETSGPRKVLASAAGKDRSQLRRQVQAGTLPIRDLEAMADEVGAVFYIDLATEMLEVYGPLATPKARARQRIREARQILDELEQFTELIA